MSLANFPISEYIAKKYPKSDIVVTGSNFKECTGTYNINRNERSPGALDRHVYQLGSEYFFFSSRSLKTREKYT